MLLQMRILLRNPYHLNITFCFENVFSLRLSQIDVLMECDSCLENDQNAKEQERMHQQRIYESFRLGPFEDIVARSEANVNIVLLFLEAFISAMLFQTHYIFDM